MIYKGSFILQHTELKEKNNKWDADWQTLGRVGKNSMRKKISLQEKQAGGVGCKGEKMI